MHIGLVGAGRMGAFHAVVLAGLEQVTELSIADVDPSLARQLADQVVAQARADGGNGGAQVRTAASAHAMVDAGIDALVIAAATPAHAPLITVGAEASLPVFCEKPIAFDLATTDMAIACVERAGTYLQIGFQRRFDAAFLTARECVAGGGLGKLLSVRMCTHDPVPPPVGYLQASGGIFRDLHIHDFDALRFVTGQEVVEVSAFGAVLGDLDLEQFGDVDTTAALLRLEGGALVVATGSRREPLGYDVRLELLGTLDAVAVGVDARTPLRSLDPVDAALPGDRGYDFFIDRFADAYRAQMAAFVRLVRDGGDSPCTGDDARRALLIAMACERSRAEARPVRVAEVDSVAGTA